MGIMPDRFNSTSGPSDWPIMPPQFNTTSGPVYVLNPAYARFLGYRPAYPVWWDRPGAHPGSDCLALMALQSGRNAER